MNAETLFSCWVKRTHQNSHWNLLPELEIEGAAEKIQYSDDFHFLKIFLILPLQFQVRAKRYNGSFD